MKSLGHARGIYPSRNADTPVGRPRGASRDLDPGDGTGPELTEATRRVLEATGVEFDWDVQHAGTDVMEANGGNPLPEETLDSVRRNSTALKGPITTPIGGGFRSVNVGLRHELGMYAQSGLQVVRASVPLRGGRHDDRPREHRGPLRRDRVRAGTPDAEALIS